MKAIVALCLLLSVTAIAADDRLNVTLLYEFLCGGCQKAIRTSIGPALSKGLLQMVNLKMVPFGNATEKQNGSSWTFDCQHGADECYGNTIENCMLAHIPDVEKALNALVRMEVHATDGLTPDQCLDNTASELNLDHDLIRSCAKGDEGVTLLHQAAVNTPTHKYVPWVLIDGQHADFDDEFAVTAEGIFEWACGKYQGANKPAGCSTTYHKAPRTPLLSLVDN